MTLQVTLRNKINYEFQCFFLDLMRTSKENIFAHSEEIQMKKRMLCLLLGIAENVDEETGATLMLQSNLLESFYCFWKDMSREDVECDLKELTGKWQKFLIQRSTRHEGK